VKKIFLLLVVGCQLSVVSGQSNLSGSLNYDSKISFEQSQKILDDTKSNSIEGRKSPYLAAALSLVVPGAGEFYDESYIKSAVFVVLEATAITVGLIYNKKGDNQTNFFQNYADQHWSVVRYAKWTLKNAPSINSAVDPTKYNVFYSNGTVNWSELNRLESDIGQYYSHRLPYHGEQQYYELIGKYPQYNVGWDDFGDENTPFRYDVNLKNLTPNFYYYADERGKANSLYNVAAKAVVVVIINHIVSAIDAAWSAHSYNKNLEIHASIEKFDSGFKVVYYPQLNLQFSF